MLIELRKAGLNAESQKNITVYYEKEIVGEFVADSIVNAQSQGVIITDEQDLEIIQ